MRSSPRRLWNIFENQTRLVWVVHPDEQYVLVYHGPEPDRVLRSGDELEGEGVVPESSVVMEELFEEWDL